MLKKSDLAKQFELVVQQEIKNYQDSLNFILQSINELRESVRQIQQESLENHALIHSMQGDLAIELQSLKSGHVDLNRSFLSRLCDQKDFNDRITFETKGQANLIKDQAELVSSYQMKFDAISQELKGLKEKTELNNRIFQDNLDDLLRRFRQEILNTKNEILEMPTEASLIKVQLEEKLSSHLVDVDGIMRELRIFKSDNMITQKKIENIYTLIGRLSKQEALH